MPIVAIIDSQGRLGAKVIQAPGLQKSEQNIKEDDKTNIEFTKKPQIKILAITHDSKVGQLVLSGTAHNGVQVNAGFTGKETSSTKIINSGFFKNNAQLLTTLQSQKNIASNRNKYLRSEKEIIRKKIIENNFKKIKAEEKAKDYKRHYINELENKNYQ